MSRGAIAVLSSENLVHNIAQIKAAAPSKSIIAMVKANAYGHGIRSTAIRLDKHVDSLGVASIEEGLALRKAGVKSPIVLAEGVFEPDELLIAACQNFHVVFHDPTQLDWLKGLSLPLPLVSWLKVDSGLGRLGFSIIDAPHALNILKNCLYIKQPIGLMSHISCADSPDHSLNETQLKAFNKLANNWEGPISLANSATIFAFPQGHYDVIRPGLFMYGVSPFKGKKARDYGLKPVMTLQTRLISVRRRESGSFIGYGATYQCTEPTNIGIIAIGYGDGYLRALPPNTPVLVNGEKCHLVGRISMDMAALDLSQCKDAKVGDPVVLWGEGLPIEEIIEESPLIAYELLTGVQSRVNFHWTMG
ncbi:MAG: alanine racemase [Alphaproteobacteria bacterium]